MKKRKIIVFAYYFPPHRGAGVQRPLRLVRQLVRDGWDVTVVTSGYDLAKVDPTLVKRVPQGITVRYLPDIFEALSRIRGGKLLGRLLSFLSPTDKHIFWYLRNRREINRILSGDDFDVCFTTSYPYSTHLFGYEIKRLYSDVLWLADYRDAWSKNPSIRYKRRLKPVFYPLWEFLEKKINSRADHVLTVSPQLANCLTLSGSVSKVSVMYNGYIEDDFKNLSPHRDEFYRIVYMGSFYDERNPHLFLRPFSDFVAGLSDQDTCSVEFLCFGETSPGLVQKIEAEIPSGIRLSVQGYVLHETALKLSASASLLLLIIDHAPDASSVVTGKLLEYIRLYSPILGIVPLNGAAAEIINKCQAGICFAPGESQAITQFLQKDFASWKVDPNREAFNKSKNWEVVKEFSEESQYKNFIKLIPL